MKANIPTVHENIPTNAPTKLKPRIKLKSTADRSALGECNICIVVIEFSHMVVGKVNMHSTISKNGIEGDQSGDNDPTDPAAKRKRYKSTGQMSRAQSVNLVAGLSHSDRQRRLPRRPDANVPTPSPKKHHK